MTTLTETRQTLVHRALSRFSSPREVRFDLDTIAIAGNLQWTRNGLFAWYVLGGQQWDFKTLESRRQLWDQQTYRWGQLGVTSTEGRPIRLRVTTRPYPAFEYARSLDEATPEPLPQVPGGESWNDYLGHAQRRLATTSLDQRVVFLGVGIAPSPGPKVRAAFDAGQPTKEVKAILTELAAVDTLMAGAGFDGRPATTHDMAFLMHRSLTMGVPAPVHAGVGGSRWEATDLIDFTGRRAWITQPYGTTVEIHSEARGHPVTRHVAVLSMGLMPPRTWPESGHDPFLIASNRLPFPVEWSLNGTIVPASVLAPTIEFEQRRAEAIGEHYREHHTTPPPNVGRAIADAADNLDQVTEGDSRTSARFLGTIRAAVWGNTPDEAIDRASKLKDHYGNHLNMPLEPRLGQKDQLREFIPGERRVPTGHLRRLPVRYLASSLANVDSELGTPTGPYLGYGSGSIRRAIRFDPHFGPEVLNTPGLYPIVAEPGAGKSVLIGTLAHNAVRAGEPTIIFDPSGPLARLAELPELAPFSKVLDLTAAQPGTLSPYQLIPEPTRDAYTTNGQLDEVEYERAKRRAAAERQQLMFDVLRMWLPASTLRLPGCDVMLRDALRSVATMVAHRGHSDTMTNPRWVIEALEKIAKRDNTTAPTDPRRRRRADTKNTETTTPESTLAAQLVAELTAAAEFPLGELIMPPHRHAIEDTKLDDATMVVITMPGLNPPPESVDRDYWSADERYTQPLLHLAAFYASRFIYSRPREVRKNVFLDENHLMARWGSGRAFFIRLSRDSRKWNTAIGAASQHPADHLSIGRIDALMGSAFVGRLTNPNTAREACELIQCPTDYAAVIQSLSPKPRDGETADTGEFILLDPLGRIGRMRVDIDWHPALRGVLQTTPGRPRPAKDMTLQPAPFIDPDLFGPIAPQPAPQEALA